MIEIIGIAIGMLLMSCICFFIADRFCEHIFIVIPMVVLAALCIAIVIVVIAMIACHYANTLGLNIGN